MYQVVLLIEEPLSHVDAQQIGELHEGLDDPTHLHVLLPVEDASHRVESALGSIAASEVLSTSSLNFPDVDLGELQREIVEHARTALDHSVDMLRRCGCEASGEITSAEPVEALASVAEDRGAEEAIILTRPHLVAEFFHVDWTSKARRHLGVPVLHLLEHKDPDGPVNDREPSQPADA